MSEEFKPQDFHGEQVDFPLNDPRKEIPEPEVSKVPELNPSQVPEEPIAVRRKLSFRKNENPAENEMYRPTPPNLNEYKIEADLLGDGSRIHDLNNLTNALSMAWELGEEVGWNDEHRTNYDIAKEMLERSLRPGYVGSIKENRPPMKPKEEGHWRRDER